MLRTAFLLATGVIAGACLGLPSGWHLYAALNVPAVSSVHGSTGTYTATMRRDLTNEIRWLNYAAKHKGFAR